MTSRDDYKTHEKERGGGIVTTESRKKEQGMRTGGCLHWEKETLGCRTTFFQ